MKQATCLFLLSCVAAFGETATITILNAGPTSVPQDGTLTVRISITNTGSQDWTPANEVACPDIYPTGQPSGCAPHPEGGKYTVYAEVRPANLIDQNTNGGAFALPPIVRAGETVEVTGSFRVHLPPGSYTLIPETALAARYGFGPNGITNSATDQWYAFPHFNFQVVPADLTPPSISFTGQLAGAACELWPPSGKMVNVGSIGANDPESGLALLTVTVTSGDSTFSAADFSILSVGPELKTVLLRAFRTGSSDGRQYQIAIEAANTQGGVTRSVRNCTVPHDQGK